MNYESAFLAKLEGIITAMGGVVPVVTTPTSFQERSLALLDALQLGSQASPAIRQIVLSGPVDASGRADFLEAGTGLQVRTKTLSPALVLAFGDGFSGSSPVDSLVARTDTLTWSALPASSTSFLYVDLAGGVLTAGHGTLAPVYALARPGSPASGQFWYPTDHRSRGEVWNGSAWVPTLRLYLGEVLTTPSVPDTIRSYAYQGFAVVGATVALSTLYVYSHDTGYGPGLLSIDGYFNSITGSSNTTNLPNGSGGYLIGAGSVIPVDTSFRYSHLRHVDPTLLHLRTGNVGIWYGAVAGWYFTGATANIVCRRNF